MESNGFMKHVGLGLISVEEKDKNIRNTRLRH
jgi:hypothetical protein